MKTIPLTRGLEAIVDDEDFDRLNAFRWFALSNGRKGSNRYVAARTISTADGRKTILMHRTIADVPAGQEVDHANRNTLDNRRANLRRASRSQNMANVPWVNPLGRGVSKHRNRFKAIGSHEGRVYRLGHYATAAEAARAYDAFAREHHGSFAVLNFPDTLPHSEAA